MIPGVDVSAVDGSRESGSGLQAPGRVACRGEPFQRGKLDYVGAVDANMVLAVLLRPVERAVHQSQQLLTLSRVPRCQRDPRAYGDRSHLAEIETRHSADDRLGRRHRFGLAVAGQQDGELIAAEPEGLARLA